VHPSCSFLSPSFLPPTSSGLFLPLLIPYHSIWFSLHSCQWSPNTCLMPGTAYVLYIHYGGSTDDWDGCLSSWIFQLTGRKACTEQMGVGDDKNEQNKCGRNKMSKRKWF
jgi:hypothetical protein